MQLHNYCGSVSFPAFTCKLQFSWCSRASFPSFVQPFGSIKSWFNQIGMTNALIQHEHFRKIFALMECTRECVLRWQSTSAIHLADCVLFAPPPTHYSQYNIRVWFLSHTARTPKKSTLSIARVMVNRKTPSDAVKQRAKLSESERTQ
jgi:hypothetical protein